MNTTDDNLIRDPDTFAKLAWQRGKATGMPDVRRLSNRQIDNLVDRSSTAIMKLDLMRDSLEFAGPYVIRQTDFGTWIVIRVGGKNG